MKTRITLIASLFLVGLFFSCENLVPELLNEEITSIAEDEILSIKSEDVGDEDAQTAMFGGEHRGFGERMMGHRFNSDCATVTESGEEYPREIVIDYGDGCEGKRGEVITGKIIVSMSAEMHEAGATLEMKYEDFFIGDKQVEMLKTKTNQGLNGDGNWLIESTEEKTITHEDGTTSSRTSNSSTEWLAGFETEEKEDDVFHRSGSGLVITSEGDEFTREITTPLLFDRSCDYIKSGVVELNKGDSETVIDFGDGDCDQWATVTKDGESKEVDLSERGRKGKGFTGKDKGKDKGKGKGKGKG